LDLSLVLDQTLVLDFSLSRTWPHPVSSLTLLVLMSTEVDIWGWVWLLTKVDI